MERQALANTGAVKGALTEQDIRAQVNLIQKVMKTVMQDKQHYGVIPGCGNKPTLFKAGAEKLMSTFRIALDPIVEDLSTDEEARYRITAKGTSQVTGCFLGAGVGECSSNETKYKWRASICDDEYNGMPENLRREKYQKDFKSGKILKIKQVKTEHADIANTILKMAKKRAQVDMVLTVTAASDIFTQDIEDIPAEIIGNKQPTQPSKPAVSEPKATGNDESKNRDIFTAPVNSVIPLVRGVIAKMFISKKDANKIFTKYEIVCDNGKSLQITVLDKPIDGVGTGVVLIAENVKVGEYNNERQYVANIVRVEA